MTNKFYTIALAALALSACAPVYDTDKLPIEPLPEPVIVYEGSGALRNGDEAELKSTYSWKADGDAINFEFNVNTDEYAESGAWEIGHFILDAASVGEFLGCSVMDLNDDVFTAVQPDGSATAWTSYAPGMWVDTEGASANWSTGSLYWQWYLYEASDHDYDFATHKSLFVLGGNPSNTPKCAGSTIVTKALITLGDRKIDFVVTVKFSASEGGEEGGEEGGDEPAEPEASMDYLTEGNGGYAYQGAAQGNHQYMWIMDENGITVDVDAHIPSIEDYVYLTMAIDPDLLKEYLDIDDINKLADFDYFYPVDAEGTKGEKWTTGYTGNWVLEDGSPCTWTDGRAYWFLNYGDHMYENHYTDGLLCIGTNPGNISKLDGKTVTMKSVLGDKTFTVNVHYHDSLPTSGAGVIGANSYSWELDGTAFNINATVSKAGLDDSWGLLGFPINSAYVNDYFDINVDELTIEDFYPVDAEGNAYEKWSSYAPGEWFAADGSAADSNSGIAFWQWYNASNYNYDLDNLVYLGKNSGIASAQYKAGDVYVAKAKMAGNDLTVTITVAE
ncbi:MAG: hypothetical protein KBT05_08485 [Bacteroidales bacterium]|nr:hypothetical protein [Candidatus Cryptobacteroides caccocaballi]